MDYEEGKFETLKFKARKGPYYEGLAEILSHGYEPEDPRTSLTSLRALIRKTTPDS